MRHFALACMFALCELSPMSNHATTVVSADDLRKTLGLSRSYAWELASGTRTPSMEMAIRIRDGLGVPLDAWPMPKKVRASA